jgi:acetolactate synthase small subunit
MNKLVFCFKKPIGLILKGVRTYTKFLLNKGEIKKTLKIYSLINYIALIKNKILGLIFKKNREKSNILSLNKYLAFNIITVKEYCERNQKRYHIMEKEEHREVCIPHCFGYEPMQIKRYISPEIYIAELENVKVIGENSVVLTSDYALHDIQKQDVNNNRYDLRFASVKDINRDLMIVELKYTKEKIDTAISLIGFAAFNYYHLTVELLTRLMYVDKLQISPCVSIVVSRNNKYLW